VTLVRDIYRILPLRASTIGVVSFIASATQVEDAESRTVLGRLARQYVHCVVEVTPDDGSAAVLARLEGMDAVLVGTARATQSEQQREIVQALLESKSQVVVVALRDPFDLLAFPEAPSFLVAYGEGENETRAVLDVILGCCEPRGRLPVSIPGLYPLGHGIRSFTA
jgi:beta-N-acetylhexosaminidase